MNKHSVLLLVFSLFVGGLNAQTYKPYIMGARSDLDISATDSLVKDRLANHGFEVVGDYSPAGNPSHRVLIITSPELLDAASRMAGLAGFAAVLRVALVREAGKISISYTNPDYWLNAYYGDDYPEVSQILVPIASNIDRAMQECGNYSGRGFGSEKGIETSKLRNYRYMVGMQKFHNTVKLSEFSDYAVAIDKIESNLIKGVPDVEKVYSVQIPGHDLVLYGFALGGEKGESSFLPVIDTGEPRHGAFLPYEFLVLGKEVHMLHGRFRIALSFPDLTMGTFSRIMSTPGDIRDLLKKVLE